MLFHWLNSYGISGQNGYVGIQSYLNPSSHTSFPNNIYMELSDKYTEPSLGPANNDIGQIYTWSIVSNGNGPADAMEFDTVELYQGFDGDSYGDSGASNHNGSSTDNNYNWVSYTSQNNLPSGWDTLHYHKYMGCS
jgi:hypothetical protein